jgi:hypothetical protein
MAAEANVRNGGAASAATQTGQLARCADSAGNRGPQQLQGHPHDRPSGKEGKAKGRAAADLTTGQWWEAHQWQAQSGSRKSKTRPQPSNNLQLRPSVQERSLP